MNRLLRRRVAFGALIALALLVALAAVPLVNAHFTSRAAGSGRWTIRGHLVPAVRGRHALAQRPDNAQALDLSISLSLRNQSALTQLIAAQNNPHSGLYHQYLSTREFQARFSPTQATVNQVTAWLRSQGLVVHSVAANHLLIDASGSVATVEAAFQTTLASYQVNGRTVYAPTVEPSVPDSLTGLIVNIGGLDDVGIYTHAPIIQNHSGATRPHAGSGPGGGYTPSELRTAYDMNALISSADGTGQTVAIFELDGYTPADVNSYLSYYGLGSAKYSNVLVDGATNTAGPGAIEVELDMEVVSAIAPGATQKIYIGPNDHIGVQWTYNQIVVDNIAKVTSTSWGLCEAYSNTSDLQALDNIFAEGAAQGQAFFAASGDAGAYDCGDTNLGVDSPADDPNVVGAGGTNLQTGSGGSYTSESVWSDPSDPTFGPEGVGSGGGLSTYFAKPSYQTGPGTTNSYSNGKRQVPDVSADADPNTGYSVYCSVTASGCSSATPWIEVGGTSAAAPLWAGIATDLNQYLTANSKPGLGTANATLYSLFSTSQTYTPFHDITSGNNLYYPATSGYDQASGIGTPDVWNMARDLLAADRISDFTMNVPTSTSVPEGYISNLTITTAVISGSASAISLSANGSHAGLTGSFNPASVAPGRSTTLTVSAQYSVPPGNYTLAVTGTEGSVSHTYMVAITVTSNFAISASPSNITVVQGTSGIATVSAVGSGNITLVGSVYRPGPTVSFSPPVITANSTSTLIVSVDFSTPPGYYTVMINGLSGGMAQYTAISMTVVAPGNSGGMTNGGFETGTLSNWTSTGAAAISAAAHSGSDAAQLGATSPSRGDSSISQTFTVDSDYTLISFWYKIVCPDSVNFDWATAILKDNTSSAATTILPHTCSDNGTWVQLSAPVTAGDSYTLTLSSHDDNYPGDGTYTLFDDVTLATTTPIPFLNGGFEQGSLNSWVSTGATAVSATARSGSYSALVGSTTPFAGDSSISQTVTIPTGATTLTFYYQIACHDTVSYDWATATLKDNTTNVTRTVLPHTCANSGAWVQVTVSMVAGDSYTLTLIDHDDDWVGDPTYTYFDDVSIS